MIWRRLGLAWLTVGRTFGTWVAPIGTLFFLVYLRALVATGMALELPKGFEAQIRPRSGLALKDGVTVLNSPGTIDADYRGEIGVILVNFGDKPFVVRRGARIAQLVVCSVERVALISSERLTSSVRGSKGFGSTGRSS